MEKFSGLKVLVSDKEARVNLFPTSCGPPDGLRFCVRCCSWLFGYWWGLRGGWRRFLHLSRGKIYSQVPL